MDSKGRVRKVLIKEVVFEMVGFEVKRPILISSQIV